MELGNQIHEFGCYADSIDTIFWHLTIGICAKEYMDFDEILRDIRQKFTDVIKDIESLPTVKEYKYDYMVDLI